MEMVIEALNTLDPAAVSGALGLLGATFVVIGGVMLLGWLLNVIGSYKMFLKAGEAGWKAIIPFLDDYTRFDLYWNKHLFWAYLVTMVGSSALGIGGSGFGIFLSTLCAIAVIILIVKLHYETARCFGKGVGMTVLLTLLPGIGALILGFGNAQYQGKKKISDAEM